VRSSSAAGNNVQFRKLCEVIGAPELADDPRFAVNQQRTANRAELWPLLTSGSRPARRPSGFGAMTAAGVPCGPINTVDAGIALAARSAWSPS